MRLYCYAQNPNPPLAIGRSQGGSEAKIRTERPCLKEPNHVGHHRDIDGTEWR